MNFDSTLKELLAEHALPIPGQEALEVAFEVSVAFASLIRALERYAKADHLRVSFGRDGEKCVIVIGYQHGRHPMVRSIQTGMPSLPEGIAVASGPKTHFLVSRAY